MVITSPLQRILYNGALSQRTMADPSPQTSKPRPGITEFPTTNREIELNGPSLKYSIAILFMLV